MFGAFHCDCEAGYEHDETGGNCTGKNSRPNVGVMLGQRRRRWTSIAPTLVPCVDFIDTKIDGYIVVFISTAYILLSCQCGM